MWILHVDMDAFVASVELRRHPELVGQPIAVGGRGDPQQARMVVMSASYEARALGIHAGLPLRRAVRKVPSLVVVPVDQEEYLAASEEILQALRRFPVPIEPWGLEEFFLSTDRDDPEDLALEIQASVLADTRLVCTVGIGENKLQAKMATRHAKPARIFKITRENWPLLMDHRPAGDLWGIGERTAEKLAELGIGTIAELGAADEAMMAKRFGPTIGPRLARMGRGEGDTEIVTEPRQAQSRSHAVTYPADLTDRAEIAARVEELARELATSVIADGRQVVRVAVTVRNAAFFTKTLPLKLPEVTTDPELVASHALLVLEKFPLDRPVRLLGVRVDLS